MTTDGLSLSLQENLLILVCFSPTAAPIIRNSVEPRLFGNSTYREVAARVYDYFDKFKEPPADHVPDLVEDRITGSGPEVQSFLSLLEVMNEHRDKVNERYALDQLARFVRTQSLKRSVISAGEALQEDDLERVEEILQEGLKQRLSVFSPGMSLSEGLSLAYAKQIRRDVVPLGIKQVDEWDLGPARGEFHLFIAPPKAGKSWWLVHVAKRSLLHRLRVLYVSLELSEAQIVQRMLQSLFAMSRRKAVVPVTRLRTDSLGRLLHFDPDRMKGRPSFDDPTTAADTKRKLLRSYGEKNFVVKQFPSGSLTVRALVGYLDMLERASGFIPDVLVLDYPDYMKIDPRNYRFEIGAIYNDLRGLAVEHNIAVVVAKRSNREGAKARLVSDIHAAEDYSAIYTADTIFTYSQTPPERELGLARLFASNSRVAERDRFVVLISQAYPVGQFCLDSTAMSETYWGHVEQASANGIIQHPQVEEEDGGWSQ